MIGAVLASTLVTVVASGVDAEFPWAVITDVGNAAFTSPLGLEGGPVGRGSVSYEYRISKLEVTTAQWMEFLNAVAPLQPTSVSWGRPASWGAEDDFSAPSGTYRLRTDVANAAMLPVIGISWRHAAMYCNFLHNGKEASLAAIENGAYDISTFTRNPDGTYNDQTTHNAGARYWIPTFDEWLKAVHYDPNKNGPGEGGWWQYSVTSDARPIAGMPGVGQTSAGEYQEGGIVWPFDPALIPLGAYADVASPWGLLDVSGGAQEWTEEWSEPQFGQRWRYADGTFAGQPVWDGWDSDSIGRWDFMPPTLGGLAGLRIASDVPAPGSVVMLISAVWPGLRRRRG